MFKWAFERFHEAFRVRPGVFFTDGDQWMIAALEELSVPGGIWEGMLHFYCVFHLWKNMFKHVSPLYVGQKENWREVATNFWRVTKETDERSVLDFQKDWSDMISLVKKTATKGANVDKAVAWLEGLGKIAQKWVARYTWATLTYGIHSTQRAEAIHSAIKKWLRASTSLRSLVAYLVQYNIESRTRKAAKGVTLALRQAAAEYSTLPVVEAVRGKINAVALDMLLQQASQALEYNCTELPPLPGGGQGAGKGEKRYQMVRIKSAAPPVLELDEKGEMKSWNSHDFELGLELYDRDRITTFTSCSCQYTTAVGLPCRHIIGVYVLQQRHDFCPTLFAGKWLNIDEKQKFAMKSALLAVPKAGTARSSRSAPTTKAERFAKAMSALRPLADIMSSSDGNLHAGEQWVAQIVATLRDAGVQGVKLPPPPPMPAAAAARAGVSASAIVPAATGGTGGEGGGGRGGGAIISVAESSSAGEAAAAGGRGRGRGGGRGRGRARAAAPPLAVPVANPANDESAKPGRKRQNRYAPPAGPTSKKGK
jgi:hypothetical protein